MEEEAGHLEDWAETGAVEPCSEHPSPVLPRPHLLLLVLEEYVLLVIVIVMARRKMVLVEEFCLVMTRGRMGKTRPWRP